MKRTPKVRVQVMLDIKDLELLGEIDAEHDGQLNYSQIIHILIQRYNNYQRVMKLLQQEIEKKEQQQRELEYQLRRSKDDIGHRNNSNVHYRVNGNDYVLDNDEPKLVQERELQITGGDSKSRKQTKTKKTGKGHGNKPKKDSSG